MDLILVYWSVTILTPPLTTVLKCKRLPSIPMKKRLQSNPILPLVMNSKIRSAAANLTIYNRNFEWCNIRSFLKLADVADLSALSLSPASEGYGKVQFSVECVHLFKVGSLFHDALWPREGDPCNTALFQLHLYFLVHGSSPISVRVLRPLRIGPKPRTYTSY